MQSITFMYKYRFWKTVINCIPHGLKLRYPFIVWLQCIASNLLTTYLHSYSKCVSKSSFSFLSSTYKACTYITHTGALWNKFVLFLFGAYTGDCTKSLICAATTVPIRIVDIRCCRWTYGGRRASHNRPRYLLSSSEAVTIGNCFSPRAAPALRQIPVGPTSECDFFRSEARPVIS